MCENCPEEEKELVKLLFVGGRDKKGRNRGRYLTYDTGKVYLMPKEYAQAPYWELVDGEVIEETEDVKQGFNYSDKEFPPESSRGLTREFNKDGPSSDADFILAMDTETLKHFIVGQGGKVDGRWGLDRLIEEAKKLQ